MPYPPCQDSLATFRRLAAFGAVLAVLAGRPGMAVELEDRAGAWAAGDAQVLARAAPRLADSALAPTFRAMDQRISAYADWVYGWLPSLLTAWELAVTGAAEAQRKIAAGQVPDATSLHHRLAAVVQERFDATVVFPERTDAAVGQAWQRAMARVAALDVALAADRRARIERAASLDGSDPAPALQRFGAPLLTAAVIAVGPPAELSAHALSNVEDGAGGTAQSVLVRSLRPLATRATSVTTRLLLAPVAGGLVASPIAGTNGLVAAGMTLLTVSAGIWGLDYVVNRVDAALTRPAFEAELRLLVHDAHARASRIARRHAEATVCAALPRAAPCGAAAPVAGTVPGG